MQSTLHGDYPGGIRVRWSPVNLAYFVLWGFPETPDSECALLTVKSCRAETLETLASLGIEPNQEPTR